MSKWTKTVMRLIIWQLVKSNKTLNMINTQKPIIVVTIAGGLLVSTEVIQIMQLSFEQEENTDADLTLLSTSPSNPHHSRLPNVCLHNHSLSQTWSTRLHHCKQFRPILPWRNTPYWLPWRNTQPTGLQAENNEPLDYFNLIKLWWTFFLNLLSGKQMKRFFIRVYFWKISNM